MSTPRNQPVLRAIEVADAFELRRALQRAIQALAPAVIRTAKNAGAARALPCATAAAWCRQTLKKARSSLSLPRTMRSGSPASAVVTNCPALANWVGACHDLPCAAEDLLAFQTAQRAESVYHAGGDGGRVVQQSTLVVVRGEDVVDAGIE